MSPDPITAFDLMPLRGVITAPIQTLKGMLRGMAKGTVLNAVKDKPKRPPARLPPKGTPERRKIEKARDDGIKAKKAQELENIRGGGEGSGAWTKEELEDIRRKGEFPDDAQWHHDPTVANRPDLAHKPESVHIIRGGREAHFEDGHGRNWQNPRNDITDK